MTTNFHDWAKKLIVFDTETTGTSPATARIVSACVAIIDESGQSTERHDWIINPGVEIPAAASAIHGISTEFAQASGIQASTGVSQIQEKLKQFIFSGLPLVVYNAPYDLTLLKNEAMRHGLTFEDIYKPVLDPLVIDKQVDKYRRGKRTLSTVSEHYGVSLDDAHDAGADAIAAGQVMQEIATRHKTHLPVDVEELHQLQVGWSLEQAKSFEEYVQRTRDSSFRANGSWPIR